MGKKSAPPPPDYTAAAEATAASNKEATTAQTWANRANQTNPWGSLSWSTQSVKDPATGQLVTKWTQNTALDPRLQQALNSQIDMQNQRSAMAQGLLSRVSDEYSQPMQWSNLNPWGKVSTQTQAGEYDVNPYNTDTSRQGVPGLQRSLNYRGLQDVDDSTASRQRAEDAIYQSASSRLDPQWGQQETDLQTRLANQGITQGSAAYTKAMDDFSRQKTDAYAQAQMAAITGAGAEAQRNQGMDMALRQQQQNEANTQGNFYNQAAQQAFAMGDTARASQLAAQAQAFNQQYQSGQFGLAQDQAVFNQQLQAANYSNQLRQQQLAEQMQKRGFSLNEMQALLNGQQVGMPSFGGYGQAGNAGGVDYSGAARDQYGAAMNDYNAQQGGMTNALSGIGSLASIGMMFSDRRIKADVRRVGRHTRGFNVYTFRYIGESVRRLGVIAQEVARVIPEAVRPVGGVLAVDLALLKG